jgi:tripartite-type tricarboxylate transporter receptor subunit TctC
VKLSLLMTIMASLLAASPVLAQIKDYPQRPIRLVVPVPPGGAVDVVARLIAPKVTESLGQNVIVENRVGASSNIGMEFAARAPGDGYTLLANTVMLVANPALFPKLPFVPENDFKPVSLVIVVPSIIVTHPSVPVRNVSQFIALAKARPGVVKYSSAGSGSLTHLGAELFKYLTRTNILHVPYKGGAAAVTAVVSGESDVSFQTPLAVAGQITSGRLRAIAVTGKKRLSLLPDVPTVAEAGVSNYEFETWVGILVPASTPAAIVTRLNEHIVKAARSPEISERFAREGAEVVASTPEHFRKVIAAETALWNKVITEMGIKSAD